MSLLVDPQTFLPAVTTVEALIDLMEKNPSVSRISRESPRELKDQLIVLLESVGIVRRYCDSQTILVPLALRGRPVCWSQIIRGCSNAVLLGQRLGVKSTAHVPSASFIKVMLDKCVGLERMWGCAFAYAVEGLGAEGSSCIFVRLREDRRCIDVVAVIDGGVGSEAVVLREIDSIARLLGNNFMDASNRMLLCPMCCSADMFVRSGAVHAFHVQEVAEGGALHCSRYHDVTASDVVHGKFTKLDMDALPSVYPGRLNELHLPWKIVAPGGVISSSGHTHSLSPSVDIGGLTISAQPATMPFLGRRLPPPPLPPVFSRAPELSSPFFQRADLSAEAAVPTDALQLQAACARTATTPIPSDDQSASFASPFLKRNESVVDAASGADTALFFRSNATAAAAALNFSLEDGTFTDVSFFVLTGQVSAGDVIAAEQLPEFQRLLSLCASQDCSCDVALSSGVRKTLYFSYTVGQYVHSSFYDQPISCIFPADIGDRAQHSQPQRRFCAHDNVLVIFGPVERGSKFLVLPGSSMNLQLCRLTPALCQNDLTAACCWSELQDQFAIVMGHEFEMYEITALMLLRNDARAECFASYLQELRQRARTLPSTPLWCKTAHDVATLLSAELEECKPGIERAGVDVEKLAGMTDFELLALASSVGGSRLKEELRVQLQGVKAVCEAQIATMRHFDEFTAKFSVRPPHENTDVNLTVAWWGSARENSVYLSVAQNGFVNLPNQLKTDPGYFGSGFYFTRYPRYSDYYISGCELFAKDVGASFLMSYVACGRPFPVTQHPGNPLPLYGQPCSPQSSCGGGTGRHDSHYVCVKRQGDVGDYYPCPPRQQPDYDEIVVFNPNAVLPVAVVEFKRRRRTLLWLDDNLHNNFLLLRTFPGCPHQAEALQVQAYPMRQHCAACHHGLTMDPNPHGTAKECERARATAKAVLDNVQADACGGDLMAQGRLQNCTEQLRLAEAALACAQAAAAAVTGVFAGRDIIMEEQVDVVLFTSSQDMARFLSLHPELSKYPPSLLRMISNRRLLQEGGLLHFLDSNVAWRHKYPTIFMLYSNTEADTSSLRGRPNFYMSTQQHALQAFATFKSTELLPCGNSAAL